MTDNVPRSPETPEQPHLPNISKRALSQLLESHENSLALAVQRVVDEDGNSDENYAAFANVS